MDAPPVSVIIPALDEARHVAAAVSSATAAAEGVEVLVIDGGSGDRTAERAAGAGARVLSAPPHRARQLRLGAEAATGELLVFLHADTTLPAGWLPRVRRTLDTPGVAAGAFRLTIEGAAGWLRLMELGANLRARLGRLPYGDQALFVTAAVYRETGGFAELELMEDVDLVRRLRRRGRLVIAPEAVTTSARRWRRLGPWRTWAINQLLVAAWACGMPPGRLQRWYAAGTLRPPGPGAPARGMAARPAPHPRRRP